MRGERLIATILVVTEAPPRGVWQHNFSADDELLTCTLERCLESARSEAHNKQQLVTASLLSAHRHEPLHTFVVAHVITQICPRSKRHRRPTYCTPTSQGHSTRVYETSLSHVALTKVFASHRHALDTSQRAEGTTNCGVICGHI